MKKTLEQKLAARELHQPNGAIYWVLMQVAKLMNKGVNTHFDVKKSPVDEPDSFVYIANHASRNDYLFTAPICYPRKLNFVVGYNEFMRFPIGLILRMMQVIPKKNFTADLYCIHQIMNVVKQGGNICIMPEGMSSITGMAQPVIPGGAKLIKKLGKPVYYSKISGGYMTYTKHCLDERKGRIDVIVDQMFTADDLKRMSEAEIEDTMNRLLAHDDYIWNKEQQVKFDGKGQMAKQLDTLLYMCPKCGAMGQMHCEGNRMRCKACGNEIEMDECYNIKPVGQDSVCPELVTDWTILERQKAALDVRTPGFSYTEHVRIGTLPPYKMLTGDDTSILCGEGDLTLNEAGLHFVGTRDGAPYSFDLPSSAVPTYGMCTDISRLYTFADGEFIEFYFDKNIVLRWDHLTEELHRAQGGKWQNTEYRHYN